jgi:FkbM family methyltransferase
MSTCLASLRGEQFTVSAEHPYAVKFWQSASAGRWEDETLRFVKRYTTPETVFVDVGAWIGPISLYASTYARKVLAIEPDPGACQELERNAQANATNIEIIRGAVDTKKGTLTLHVPSGSKGFVSSLKIDDGQPFAVSTITFDEISALVGSSPAALKIDIEGHEYYIIDQAVAFARRHSAPLHIAVHPRFYFADIRRSQGAISARQRTWRATCALGQL